jgi:hypothetical protein
MATSATQVNRTLSGKQTRVANLRLERIFFSGMAALILFSVLLGFAQSYYLRGYPRSHIGGRSIVRRTPWLCIPKFPLLWGCMTMLPGPFYQGYRGRIWRTVVVALALLVISCLALAGYRPARYTFDAIHRFAPFASKLAV